MRDEWTCPALHCDWTYLLPPADGSVRYTRSLAAVIASHADTHPRSRLARSHRRPATPTRPSIRRERGAVTDELPAWLSRMRDHHEQLPASPEPDVESWFDGMTIPEEWFA